MSLPVGTTATDRGFLLDRIRRVLKDVRPGALFPTTYLPPTAGVHRQIVSDFGGRVYGQIMGGDWHKTYGMPAVDVCEMMGGPDTFTATVSPMAEDTKLHLVILIYCADPGGGKAIGETDGTYQVKWELDQAVADVIIAMQAVPYWVGTDPNHPEDMAPACARLGWIGIQPISQATDIYQSGPWGNVELRYDVCYLTNELFG